MAHINHDKAYNAVERDDFQAMIDPSRYAERSPDFDAIISATRDHHWDPNDPLYIDFDAVPFDLDAQLIMPREFVLELNCAVADKLDPLQIRLGNEVVRFNLSSLLHGEQGALSLSASLCQILLDPGAQEYAANQAREEARHVAGFSRYIQTRYGRPLACGNTLSNLLNELVGAPEVYKKLVGMQMLIEGLAMGAFATLHSLTNDPLLRRLVQLVMSDEAFHHRFGKIWAKRTVPKLREEEHIIVEDWAASCFQTLLLNLVNPEQKQAIYLQFGLDWQWVRGAIREAFTGSVHRSQLTHSTSAFRVLIKTLLNAGIITERTRVLYATWVDMDALQREPDEVVGHDIAMRTVDELRELNQTHAKVISRALRS